MFGVDLLRLESGVAAVDVPLCVSRSDCRLIASFLR
ncbi:hypothetical protein M3J09_003503 [Ascochyta lentis]